MIEGYRFGMMVVDGKKYTADLILLPDRVISSWWRKEGHSLCLDDLQDVLQEDIEVLVLGTGFFGLMKVLPEVHRTLESRGIFVSVAKTSEAIRTFNEISSQKKTAGAFHLTC